MSAAPITFTPLFMQRVWGGRRLESAFGKKLPADAVIGESWELVDRDPEQSVADDGRTLNDLWTNDRAAVFGSRGQAHPGGRFPILIKLLDAQQTLSVQVHPPARVAPELGGEPKNEMWIVAEAAPGAHLYAGLKAGVDRATFEGALDAGDDVSELLHRIDVARGDAIVIPAGRVHAIGAGCVIAEIQETSDTTYRVFDFDRPGLDGEPRDLHVEESMRSIDFHDVEPALVQGDIATPYFVTERWTLQGEEAAAPAGECAVVIVLDGEVGCGGRVFKAGEVFLVPATDPPSVRAENDAQLLRVLLPETA